MKKLYINLFQVDHPAAALFFRQALPDFFAGKGAPGKGS